MFGLKHGVIVSCDVKTIEELRNLVRETCSVKGVVGYKIGFILGLNFGLRNVVLEIKDIAGMPVIYDHQKAGTDIPQMGTEFAAVMKQAGADSAIIFPQAGPKTQEAFIKALIEHGIVPMVGGEMSHEGYLAKDGGYMSDDAPQRMYTNGSDAGAEFFVVPGNKPDSIKKYSELLSKGNPKFCMPGIGRQGGGIEAAFRACSGFPAYAIVGASIYKAAGINAAAKQFCAEAMKFE